MAHQNPGDHNTVTVRDMEAQHMVIESLQMLYVHAPGNWPVLGWGGVPQSPSVPQSGWLSHQSKCYAEKAY